MKTEADVTTPPDRLLPESALKAGLTTAKRALYIGGAAAFLGLGVAGIILPGLPATPFLLLASYFLVRSSPQLNDRLLNSRLFGPILRDWQERRGIRRSVKFRSICVVFASVLLTCYFSNLSWTLLAIVVATGIVGVAVILRLPEV